MRGERGGGGNREREREGERERDCLVMFVVLQQAVYKCAIAFTSCTSVKVSQRSMLRAFSGLSRECTNF